MSLLSKFLEKQSYSFNQDYPRDSFQYIFAIPYTFGFDHKRPVENFTLFGEAIRSIITGVFITTARALDVSTETMTNQSGVPHQLGNAYCNASSVSFR